MNRSELIEKWGELSKTYEGRSVPPTAYVACDDPGTPDARVEALVNDLIGRVADKWTMLILEILAEKGELRFTRLGEMVTGISQKMLTQTLRQMERDGLIVRTVHPVIPPRVEYKLTDLGFTLGAAFCGVWIWAEQNLKEVEEARAQFDARRRQAATTANDASENPGRNLSDSHSSS